MYKNMMIVVIILVCIVFLVRWYFGTHRRFREEVRQSLSHTSLKDVDVITEESIETLPESLQKYLIKTKVVGSPRVKYFQVAMNGQMKMDQDKPYAPVKVQQYTFIESGVRLFYMTMDYKGIPIAGLHHYNEQDAYMKIKILDLIKVVDESGPEMLRAETVTYFNDLCIMAPGALLEEDITWETLAEGQVKGTLRKHGQEVSAILYFNEDGTLENFVSEDRMAVNVGGSPQSVPWSTPMAGFGSVGNFTLPNVGKAVWHYDHGDFDYIHLTIDNVLINQP